MVFDHSDYKSYLQKALATSGETRGRRTQLAEHLGCQAAFISQVLNGPAHFSLEHALLTCRFLDLREDETEYFMLLVQAGRAGSVDLERFYQAQRRQIVERRKRIAERIQVESALNPEAQATYYSSWTYAAIHILLSIPEFGSPERVADHLNLPISVVNDVLDFLVSAGLAVRKKSRFAIGAARIHLPAHSPLIAKHHINWRMQAMQSLDRRATQNLHYSLVMSLSQADLDKLRKLVLATVEGAEKIFKPSPEETTACLNLDLFSV